jgi:plastocyanin
MLAPMARVALLTLLLLSACNEEPADTTSTPSPTPQATTETSGSEESPAVTTECVDESITANTEATIRQNDNAFSPSCLIVLGGQSLKIVNRGASRHNFSIEGTSVDLDTEAGETTRTEALAEILEPGTHKFICKYHAALGMRGEITLTEAG